MIRPGPAHDPRSSRFVLDGTVEPGRVFDRTVTLEQTPDAYRAMDRREALKVPVTP